MKFTKTLVASFIGAALSTTAAASLAANFSDIKYGNASGNNTLPVNTLAKKHATQDTVSGMRNQFDTELGKTTFQWANKKVTTPNTRVISAEHQNEFAAEFYLKQLTGIKNAKPVAIGGGTNSRLFPSAVSFGPTMPGKEYSGHSEHEYISMAQFVLNLKMYTAVFIELAK